MSCREKKRIRQAAGSALFLAGLILLLSFTSYLVLPKNNLEAFGMTDVTANGILGEPDDSIDVLVLGDSEAFCHISPMEMWQRQGFTSYVCGTSSQYLYWSDTFLRQAFQNQKPKVVILETNAIYRDLSRKDTLVNRLENWFPVFRYHNRWKSIRSGGFLSPVEYTWTDDYKGFAYNNTVDPAVSTDHMTPTEEAASIQPLNQWMVHSMARFCQENGAVFLLVSTPSTLNWNYAKHNGVQQLADTLGVSYIDMNLMTQEIPIDWSTDTRDKGDHLNYAGAVKVSTWLGQYLQEQYQLPDHRQDEAYARWNQALERYRNGVGASS